MAVESKKTGASKSGIVSVLLIYLLLLVLTYFLTGEVLLGIPDSGTGSLWLIPAAVILPLGLFVYVLINIRRLHRDRIAHNPGARFKSRLILFFGIIILLSSIPQTIISMRFVTTAINAWFSPKIGSAINGGLKLSLSYYNEQIENLETFAGSPVFQNMLSDLEKSPNRMWTNITNTNPAIDSIQIFDQNNSQFFFKGSEGSRLEEEPSLGGGEGLLPREDRSGPGVLRYLKIHSSGSNVYSIVISTILPEGLDETARQLTEAREVFLTYQKNQKEFSFLLYVFYAFFTIPLILISILISFLLSDEVIRPIVSLEAATRRVADGDFSYRILTRSGDELANLTNSFNKMMNELENSRKKILQTEKITAWQEIARQLAHELRNPLTPIKLSAERILRKFRNDPESLNSMLESAVEGIIQEVRGLDNLLKEFRDFSRLPAPDIGAFSIAELIRELIGTYRHSYPLIVFTYNAPEGDLTVKADVKQIKQVFINLFKNSCEAVGDREGRISIQTDLVRKGNSSYCRISVQDTGHGIDPEKQEQVFNPYFTTKNEGTGLGLPIVERIIFDHKGQIWFESEPGHGTTFFIDIPMEK